MKAISRLALALALSLGVTTAFAAEPPNDPAKSPATPSAAATPADAATTSTAEEQDDPDVDVNRAQPDFVLVGLPTTLRLPAQKMAFRITHRFVRPLGQGDFGDLLADGLGFDGGASMGFELRYGLIRATQIVVHRTNNRTIQFMLQRQVVGQSEDFPLSIDAFGSAEGTNNFRDSYSPGLGLIVSHEFGDRGAVYAQPFWVNNTNPLPKDLVNDNNAIMVGLGARLRLSPGLYGVFEVTPRVNGYDPGDHQLAFGVEKRAGGHLFQINIGNGQGTTFGQMARGGTSDWFIGFNISRKFY